MQTHTRRQIRRILHMHAKELVSIIIPTLNEKEKYRGVRTRGVEGAGREAVGFAKKYAWENVAKNETHYN